MPGKMEPNFLSDQALLPPIMENSPDGYAFVDMGGKIIAANAAFVEMLGYTREELFGLTYQQITPEKWWKLEQDIIDHQVLVNGHSELYQKEYQAWDGSIVPVEVRTAIFRDSTGKPSGMWALVRKVFPKAIHNGVANSMDKGLDIIIGSQKELVLLGNAEGQIKYANKAFLDFFGLKEEEAYGRTFLPFLHPGEKDAILTAFRKAFQCNDHIEFDGRVLTPKGYIWVSWALKVLRDSAEKVSEVLAVGRDISAQKEKERSLLEEERKRASEQERLGLSRELHDHLGQLLVSNKMRLENLLRHAQGDALRAELAYIRDWQMHSIKEIRLIASDLANTNGAEVDWNDKFTSLFSSVSTAGNVTIHHQCLGNSESIPDKVRIHAFRILEEGFSNILKHSGATSVNVISRVKKGLFTLSIKDNGKGCSLNQLSPGSGLVFMKQRAQIVGGEIEFSSRPGKYFQILLRIPLDT